VIAYLRRHLLTTAPVEHPLSGAFSSIRFSGVITTNLDDLLQRTFQVEASTIADTSSLVQALTKGEFFLLKLFGDLYRDDILLTGAHYRDAVLNNQPFGQLLKTLFHSRTILFAGVPFKMVEEFLDSVPSRSDSPPSHFALISAEEPAWRVRAASLRRRFGLRIIPYNIGNDGGGLAHSLRTLAERVRSGRPHQPASCGPHAARLAKLTLTNIGPFESLELLLHEGWNVLLGDNGMGKSTILKAVAAAIAGEEATPYAARLLKAGKTSGAVQLTTSTGDVYVLEILKSESGVFLRSIPLRPLDREGWLTLGFPPLRTISWERAQPYDSLVERRAVALDVLPLCQGEPDPRLDHLKSWLLWLDHSIMSSQDADLYRRLRNEFYRVVNEVMPGMVLGPATVDSVKRQVYVHTNDSEVPIEAVSQGTQSLMGWVGVVLQRLFEIHRTDIDPTSQYALILMDEIDAHMHPRWQLTLVGTLKRIFPNVQFIVTSHSPLVVAGLSRAEVMIFRRDSLQRVVAEHPAVDPKGWRVDQILTSLAFGLEGARDPDTQRDIRRYTELAAQDDPEDPDELASLARRLEVRLPTPIERAHARKAFEIMADFAESQLKALSADDRENVLAEIRVQLQESVTGSRRPM
jgi:predicted ATPase